MTTSSTRITPASDTTNDTDPARFRDTVGHYASGITIITGHDAHGPIGITWHPANKGIPILHNTLAWLDCTIHAEHDTGDHIIVIGHVTEMGSLEGREPDPLLYYKGQYGTLEDSPTM